MIRLNKDFTGVATRGVTIPAGEYAIDDPALQGVGQWLIAHGFAVTIDDATPQDSSDATTLDNMTKAELIEFAVVNDIDINTRDSKADLLQAIQDGL